MQLLSVAVALAALGFTLALSRSRKGVERYGIVFVVLPLALATPLVALIASGLQLIAAFRRAGLGDGLEALTTGVVHAAETQYVGHLTLLALMGALALVVIALALSQPEGKCDQEDDTEASSDPQALSKFAIPMMAVAAFVCIVAVTVLTEYEDRFVASPLAIVIAFEADDVSEFFDNQRSVDEQRRRGSNTLVAETFRSLVVVVLFLVLFDAFLVSSRSVTFKRSILLLSAALIALASVVSVRAFYRHQELRASIEKRLKTAAESEPKETEIDETELDESEIDESETTDDAAPPEDPAQN